MDDPVAIRDACLHRSGDAEHSTTSRHCEKEPAAAVEPSESTHVASFPPAVRPASPGSVLPGATIVKSVG
jgi:hypothetical protein